MSSPVQTRFDRYLAVFATRDPDRIVELHAPAGVYWQRTDREPVTGRAAIAAAFGELFAQWPDMRFEVRDVSFGPDFWVMDWILDAEGRQGRIRFDCLDVAHLDGAGLVELKHTYVDLAQAQAALARDVPKPA
jgi:hypothetical protein